MKATHLEVGAVGKAGAVAQGRGREGHGMHRGKVSEEVVSGPNIIFEKVTCTSKILAPDI